MKYASLLALAAGLVIATPNNRAYAGGGAASTPSAGSLEWFRRIATPTDDHALAMIDRRPGR